MKTLFIRFQAAYVHLRTYQMQHTNLLQFR